MAPGGIKPSAPAQKEDFGAKILQKKPMTKRILLQPVPLLAAAFVLLLSSFASRSEATEHHPFDQWRASHFTDAELLDETISGPHADPAGDGVSNLAKYALGLLPFEPSRDATPEVFLDMDRAALRFTAAESRPGVDLALGVSNNLVNWESHVLDENYGEWGTVSLGNGREEITARPPEPGGPRQFLRLEVHLVGGDVSGTLLGQWAMDEIVEGGGEDRLSNPRNVVPDDSGQQRPLILGNRPAPDTVSDPGREPSLVSRDAGFALDFDGVDDVAYVRDLWNTDGPEEHFGFSFDFSPKAPLNRRQTVMITTEHHEIRLVQNAAGTHARLWFIRFPATSMGDKAFSHWFYEAGASLDTWYHVEGWIQNGEMQITIDGEQTALGTYNQAMPIGLHHNAHYLGQTWTGGFSLDGLIDNLQMERLD